MGLPLSSKPTKETTMTHEETQAALLAAAEYARLRGIENPFTGLTTRISVHHQFGGNYQGEDHVKVFHNGKPSHLCMLRPVEGGFECLSFKRDAAELPIVVAPEPETHEREQAGDPSEEIDGLNRLADAYDRLTQSVKAANEQLEGLGTFGRVRVQIVGAIVECEITPLIVNVEQSDAA
jgi:hypothetical protein